MQVSESARRRSDPVAPIDVSIVVPAYNEADRLPRLVTALTKSVDRTGVELVIVDDGSTDTTRATALALLDDHDWRRAGRLLLRQPRQGRSGPCRRRPRRGGAFVVMDADLATDLAALDPALAALDDHDLAVGVRSSIDHGRARHRRLMTAAFGWWVRATTSAGVADTQCGFKAYRAPAATVLFAASRADGFAQDAEILDLAARLDLSVAELPVHWSAVPGSKVRAVRDSVRTAVELARHKLLGRRIEVTVVRLRGEQVSRAELASVVRPRVRRTDMVARCAGDLVVVAAGASEIAHRRIAERLSAATDDLEVGVVAVPVTSLERSDARVGLSASTCQTRCQAVAAGGCGRRRRSTSTTTATASATPPMTSGARWTSRTASSPHADSATVEGMSPISVPARNAGTVTRDTPSSQSAAGV